MSAERRVVVTGCGVVSAAGPGVGPFWRACVEGVSLLGPSTRLDLADIDSPRVGQIPAAAYPASEPATALLLEAAREALAAAGLASGPPASAGAAIGTCLGGALAAFARLQGDSSASSGSFSAPATALADELGLAGPIATVSSACASGSAALALAGGCVRRGEAEIMLAGGVDVLSRFVVVGFALLRALASAEVRPFDRRRDGLALGEAAAVLVLEEREHARARGAPLLAELLGWGSSGDANHMTGPSPTGDGVARAIRAALEDAALAPEQIDFVNAHGTGTRFNDRMETLALKSALGAHARRVPVDSIKPVVGHTLGAAGALEAILCVRALGTGIVPPTLHYAERDPECDLDYVPSQARRLRIRRALSLSSAFAGNNAALVLGAP